MGEKNRYMISFTEEGKKKFAFGKSKAGFTSKAQANKTVGKMRNFNRTVSDLNPQDRRALSFRDMRVIKKR